MDVYTAALMRERAAYIQQDRPDRVADVDAELARVGVDVNSFGATPIPAGGLETAAAPPAPETAVLVNERSAGNGR